MERHNELEKMVWASHNAGLQIIPCKPGTKEAAVKWKKYHTENYKNTDNDIKQWIKTGYSTYLVLTGKTSGNLEILDFDSLSDGTNVYNEFISTEIYDLVKDCPIVTSGDNGKHLWFYSDVESEHGLNLAYRFDTTKNKNSIVIETRASKQYIVLPFSRHPNGTYYTIECDPDDFVNSIPTILPENITKIFAVAKSFDTANTHKEKKEKVHKENNDRVYDASSPISRFNSENKIDEILEKYGYTFASQVNDIEMNYYRVGKTEGSSSVSVHLDTNTSFHYSDNDILKVKDSKRQVTPFDVLCAYEFNGDMNKAVYELSQEYNKEFAVKKKSWIEIAQENAEKRKLVTNDVVVNEKEEVIEEVVPVIKKVVNKVDDVPVLPIEAQLDYSLGDGVCEWLDDYIALSKRKSSWSADSFHAACGLWVLSTVAAGRISGSIEGTNSTNLYLILLAESGKFAKSSAAKVAKTVLNFAGLSGLVLDDKQTPEALIQDLSVKNRARNIREKDLKQDVQLQTQVQFAGQRSWYYDEFGNNLKQTIRVGSTYYEFLSLWKSFYDGPSEYSKRTVGRGKETVKRPYLSLLATTTPTDFKDVSKVDSVLWGDGTFARFMFVTPYEGEEMKEELGENEFFNKPDEIVDPLIEWHNRLGVPEINFVNLQIEKEFKSNDKDNDEKNDETNSDIELDELIEPLPSYKMYFSKPAYDAFYNYILALRKISVLNPELERIAPNYIRLGTTAGRIAVLFASFDGTEKVELKHFAKAQMYTEQFRRSLHKVYRDTQVAKKVDNVELEDKIISWLDGKEALTISEMSRAYFKTYTDLETLEKTVNTLEKNGFLIKEPAKKRDTWKYKLNTEE